MRILQQDSKMFFIFSILKTDLATREWYCEVDMSKYISLLIDTLNHDETISSLLNPVTKIKNLVSKLENK